MKNKLVILVGPPGSGKGTQALLLAEKKKMIHFEASKLLEKKFLNSSEGDVVTVGEEEYEIKEQERRWREGLLCEDGFVSHVIKESIEKTKDKKETVLLDGYPRTKKQAEISLPFFLSLYRARDILLISLEVDEEESIKRNTKRRVCALMRHSIISTPETENLTICPLDGSVLEKRVMDDPEKIKIRLREFSEKTVPIIDYLQSKKINILRVDGTGSVSDVFFRILKEVENFGL